MNRTIIEWVKNPDGSPGYTWNPITGCLNGCPYCYARKLANRRLRTRYLANDNTIMKFLDGFSPINLKTTDPFHPRFWEERLDELNPIYGQDTRSKHRGIFVCDMSDLFGIGIPEEWTQKVIDRIKDYPYHRFYLLTKQPQNLIKFSPFPDNCWVGVTATDESMFLKSVEDLLDIEAKVKYISFEPLLDWSPIKNWLYPMEHYLKVASINWLIIGACTGTKPDLIELNKRYPQLTLMPWGKKWTLQPPISWVEEIVEAADQAGIPVFLKDSLKPPLELQDITDTNFGRLTSLNTEAIKDAQGLPRQRGWYDLRQETPV